MRKQMYGKQAPNLLSGYHSEVMIRGGMNLFKSRNPCVTEEMVIIRKEFNWMILLNRHLYG